jgi:hypothetical protein
LVASCWLRKGVRGEVVDNFGTNKGLREGVRGEVGGGVDVMDRCALSRARCAETSVHAESEEISC